MGIVQPEYPVTAIEIAGHAQVVINLLIFSMQPRGGFLNAARAVVVKLLNRTPRGVDFQGCDRETVEVHSGDTGHRLFCRHG